MTTKYHDEGTLFWTFFQYLDQCFVEDGKPADSLASCFDWSTVIINGTEEVNTVQSCVENSFESPNQYESNNKILGADRAWAVENNVKFHPSIVINKKILKGNISGKELALAICEAFKEKPDECDLDWKVEAYQRGILTKFEDSTMPNQEDYIKEAAASDEPIMIKDKKKNYATERWILYLLLLVIIIVNFAVLYCVRRRLKRQVNTEINSTVN